MTDIILQGKTKNYRLRPTLELVADLEDKGGSLFYIAGRLLAQDISLSETVDLLAIVYRAAGCRDNIDACIEGRLPQELLADVIASILNAFYQLGAVAPGEARTALAG